MHQSHPRPTSHFTTTRTRNIIRPLFFSRMTLPLPRLVIYLSFTMGRLGLTACDARRCILLARRPTRCWAVGRGGYRGRPPQTCGPARRDVRARVARERAGSASGRASCGLHASATRARGARERAGVRRARVRGRARAGSVRFAICASARAASVRAWGSAGECCAGADGDARRVSGSGGPRANAKRVARCRPSLLCVCWVRRCCKLSVWGFVM